MRSRSPALALCAALLVLAGCTAEPSAAPVPAPAAPAVRPPAAAAGGACIMLDYGLIEQKLGVRFDVAAADQADDTSTCVMQREDASRPDLTLAVLERTSADGTLFLAQLKPAKAATVNGLGAAGYRVVIPASGGAGPVVEVGWLTKDAQVKTLRYTFPAGASPAAADQLGGRLVDLGKAIDATAEFSTG